MPPLTIGSLAPSFTLLASGDDEAPSSMSSEEWRGRPTIVAFYPGDFSPVCSDQMSLYNHVLDEFARYGARLVGISVDSVWCHRAFSDDRRLRFPLLADFEPKGAVARAFGVYRADNGTAERALFVIDADGVVRWSHVSPVDVNPGADGILQALAELREDPDSTDPRMTRRGTAATVNLVEYGDYECPHCRRAHPIVKALRERFGAALQFEFRDFPLAQIHPHAMHAAEAAASVKQQAGLTAYWRMHDAIFQHQRDSLDALDDAHLSAYASNIGADGARVLADLRAGSFEGHVRASFSDGVHRGVNGTPTFFVNDVRFDGDWRDPDQLVAAIERAGATRPEVSRTVVGV